MPLQSTLPFHMTGNFGPVIDELVEHDLPIEGRLPPELHGTYLRNGPNPRTGASPHWLVGDGMLHGVHIADGRARWYRNRWVGPGRDAASVALGDRLRARRRHNTHVVEHAGRVLALVEAAIPMEIDPFDLTSVGLYDFGGAVRTPVTAHPKRCPRTGELHFFGYQHTAPHLTYYVADAAGLLIRRQEIPVEGASYLHDFALTDRYAVFFDGPARMVADWGEGLPLPFVWSDGHRPRVAVVPRTGGEVRFFDIEPCQLGHTANAYERDGCIIVEAVATRHLEGTPPLLTRWQIDLTSGSVRQQLLDDRPVEFPRIDDRLTGRPHRHVYALELHFIGGLPAGAGLRRYDTTTGVSIVAGLAPTLVAGECVHVPYGPNSAEEEAYLLAFVYDPARDASDLVILDARDFAGPPVARIRLPRRVPYGFHGSWIPAR